MLCRWNQTPRRRSVPGRAPDKRKPGRHDSAQRQPEHFLRGHVRKRYCRREPVHRICRPGTSPRSEKLARCLPAWLAQHNQELSQNLRHLREAVGTSADHPAWKSRECPECPPASALKAGSKPSACRRSEAGFYPRRASPDKAVCPNRPQE